MAVRFGRPTILLLEIICTTNQGPIILIRFAPTSNTVRATLNIATQSGTCDRKGGERLRRTILISAAFAGCVAIALVFALARVTSASEPPPQLGNGTVSALSASRTRSDALPPRVAETPAAAWIESPDASRRVYADGKRVIWLAPGRSDSICHVEQATGSIRVGVGCTARSALRTGTIYATSRQADGTTSIVGVVDDAVSSVDVQGRSIPVHNNVFVVDGVKSDSVTLGLQTAKVRGPFVIEHLYPSADDPSVVGGASAG